MARGIPAIWSTLLGLPFIITGAFVYRYQTDVPPDMGIPFILFGLLIIIIGAYVHLQTPSEPDLNADESILEVRHPTQRVALANISIGIPIFVLGFYLMFFTGVPYVYPTVAILAGLYAFLSGLQTYWINSLTTYYITSDRVIKEFRLLSLIRQEIPLSKVRGVQVRKSILESLVGLGNIRVASGGGRSLEIVMSNMVDSEGFASTLRDVI